MAQPRLAAEIFVTADGVAMLKAPPLKRSEAFAIFNRDNGRCKLCNSRVKFGGLNVSPYETISSGAVDHVIPRARGGRNDPNNLQLTCRTCNSRKGAK